MATPRASASMSTTAAAARVNVRDVLRVSAVDSYMRNFAGESHRLQELLEITLCYGILCVSRNFQLKGMTVGELRSVTKFKDTKTQDFYVRNGSKQRRTDATELLADPQQLFNKPAHSWRDGEIQPEILPVVAPQTASVAAEANTPEVFFLPNEAHKDKLDEIDFYTKLLGKPFVDVAWTTYSARGSSLLNQQQLDERMIRVDQRKRPDLMPPIELPVYSFVEFLHAYVRKSIATSSSVAYEEKGEAETEMVGEDHSVNATGAVSTSREDRPKTRSAIVSPPYTSQRRSSHQRPSTPPARQEPSRSKSFQNIQSKIQPEIRAQREKILRVKKTHAQLMRESLARTRLEEYAARHDGEPGAGGTAAKNPLSVKRMPLDKITPGAAALEIVDDFIRCPLMDKFTGETMGNTSRPQNATTRRKDPLKEEIYGTAAHDDSFIGCRTPSAPKTPAASKKKAATRNYSGWLGDFGPQHTKTVKPVWATDATGDDNADQDERSSDEENVLPSRRGQRQQTQRGKTDRFEWKFDLLATPSNARPSRPTGKKKTESSSHSHDFSDDDDLQSESDKWSSVAGSDASDPVYRWLKSVTP